MAIPKNTLSIYSRAFEFLLLGLPIVCSAFWGVVFCLDFDHFFFFSTCSLVGCFSFIYLFFESMMPCSRILVKQTIVMAQWYNRHLKRCMRYHFSGARDALQTLIGCYLLEAEQQIQLTSSHWQPQVELSHRCIHLHTNGFEPRTLFSKNKGPR
jgi:hypothetical protein